MKSVVIGGYSYLVKLSLSGSEAMQDPGKKIIFRHLSAQRDIKKLKLLKTDTTADLPKNQRWYFVY